MAASVGPLGATVEIGIVGAGAMGAGIAQVAATAGHRVHLFDMRPGAAQTAVESIASNLNKLAAKSRISHTQATTASAALLPANSLNELKSCGLIVEAIVEDLAAKRTLFRELEEIVGEDTLLATNTSSLSVTAIAAGLRAPARVAGMHFFNPAPLMQLVEIISGLETSPHALQTLRATAFLWGKTPVLARSTPGFIVNRVARSFYAEALRLLNEGAAHIATIDAIMRESGGFRMGPFELMDLIGHDVNYAVTRSVFEAFFGDPRFTPSLRQRELVDAGYLGRKAGLGFYTYTSDIPPAAPCTLQTQPKPHDIRIFGDDPLARALIQRLPDPVQQAEHPDGRIAEADGVRLYRTDGRTATQRASDLGNNNLALVDLASDDATAQRLAISIADQANPQTLSSVAGLLQAAGYSVSRMDDAAGMIVMRTVAMLANEAADAVHQGVCTVEDCDTAMRLGVNYPRGPLAWADKLGTAQVVTVLDHLAAAYGEDRYRVSPLLRRKALTHARFHTTPSEQPIISSRNATPEVTNA